MAGLGEAHFGAGRGRRVVFYTNVGSGIGGALVVDGRVYGGSRGISSEPGTSGQGRRPKRLSRSSNWRPAVGRLPPRPCADARLAAALQDEHHCSPDRLTSKMVAEAAAAGNASALAIFRRATQTYGWAIAQMITLLAPEVVVIGGGVPLAGEAVFFAPLRQEVERLRVPALARNVPARPRRTGRRGSGSRALALARAQATEGSTAGLFIP